MLGGCEGLTMPGSSRGAQSCGCMPAIHMSHVTCHTHIRAAQAGLSSSAALQPQRDAQATGYHQGWDAGYRPTAFSTSRGPCVYLLWLVSDTTACGSWEAPSALSVLVGQREVAKTELGYTWVRQGRKRPRGTAGNGTTCQEHPGETQPASHPCLQHAKRRLGGN